MIVAMLRATKAAVFVQALIAHGRGGLAAHIAWPSRCLVARHEPDGLPRTSFSKAAITNDKFCGRTEVVDVTKTTSDRRKSVTDPCAHADSSAWTTMKLAEMSAAL